MSDLQRKGRDSRVVTVLALLLAASVGVCAVFPVVEVVLNVVFAVVGVVAVAIGIGLVARDLWG